MRQQRVMAIIALKEMEVGKRESGEELLEDLHEDMERVFECHEVRGRFERHVRLLPTKPAFEVRSTTASAFVTSTMHAGCHHQPCTTSTHACAKLRMLLADFASWREYHICMPSALFACMHA